MRRAAPAACVGDLVRYLRALQEAGPEAAPRRSPEEEARLIGAVRQLFLGDERGERGERSERYRELADALLAGDTLSVIIRSLEKLDFEARKDMINIIITLSHRDSEGHVAEEGQDTPIVSCVLRNNLGILDYLLDGYSGGIPVNCGSLLRELIKHAEIHQRVLQICTAEKFERIFVTMNSQNFELSSDASLLLKDLLTRNKTIVSEYLRDTPDFFVWYEGLLRSSNYATRRFSLKLLSDILLDRPNYFVMTRYITSPESLKLIMTLLRDSSQAIRCEAFHVFKIFVANPNKPEPIKRILVRNKERLVGYLESFQAEGDTDEFEDEKYLLIREISSLQ